MSASRFGQLLLPSGSLGLRAYDVLEEAVFVGPGKNGLSAQPLPFPKAHVALTWDGVGFVARALPGVAPPLVNGTAAEGARLLDGDRLEVAGETVLVRLESGRAAAPEPASAPAASPGGELRSPGDLVERRSGGSRRGGPKGAGWNHLTWVLSLVGLGLLLTAGVLAIEHMGALKDLARAKSVALEEPQAPTDPEMERGVREYVRAQAYEQSHGEDPASAIVVWRRFLERECPEGTQIPSPEALAAAARIELLHEAAGRRAWESLTVKAREHASRGRFATPLELLRGFEARFGTTAAAAGVAALREELTRGARAAFEALRAKAEPLIASAPRQAHAALISPGLELPPDLSADLAALLERAVEGMRKRGAAPPAGAAEPGEGQPRPPAPPPVAPDPSPDAPAEDPPAGDPEPERAPGPFPRPVPGPAPKKPEASEETARVAWVAAREHLLAGRHSAARSAYEAVLADHGATDLVKRNVQRLEAGRTAARAHLEGPAALLSVPAETKRGRLELEYGFDDPRVLARDFDVSKPFATDLPTEGATDKGEVSLRGGTGMLHALVFGTDVHVEAEVTVVVATDFGLLAVEESDRYRALLLNLANTRFKLKKGDAARPQPGHLLWFIGEGVWAAADPGEHGFIKIAERSTSRVENGDRGLLELDRRGERAEGGFQGKSDGVHLEGTVKGDDGKGMGSARVGVFVNGGELRVKRVRIAGTVDPAWWARRLKDLVAGDPGP